MNRFSKFAAVALLAVLAGGCASHKTAHKQANDQWNNARAAVLVRLAQDQYEVGQVDKAQETLQQAQNMAPEAPGVLILGAKLDIEQGRLESAQIRLNKAAKAEPKLAEVDYLQGVVHQRWERFDAALASYEAASRKSPTDLAFVMAQAETLVLMGQGDEALTLLKEHVSYFEHSAAIRDAIAQLMEDQGDLGRAIDFYRQASVLDNDDQAIRERLALALFRGHRYREAFAQLQRLLKLPAFEDRLDLLLASAQCQLELGQAIEARQTFDRAAQLAPASACAWEGIARSSIRIRDHRRAELALVKASALTPDSSGVALLRGLLRMDQGRLEEAEQSLLRAASLDPRDPVAPSLIGLVHARRGQADQAIAWYGKALAISPGDELASTLMREAEGQ